MRTLSLTLLVALANCGSSAQAGSALEARIDAAVASIEQDACFKTAEDAANCDWADFVVDPSTFNMQDQSDEAILIIDDLMYDGVLDMLVRYRNRIPGYYVVDQNSGRLMSVPISVRLPRRLGEALVSFAGPEFIPASALFRVSVAAHDAYGRLNLGSYMGHGGVVFGYLADLVPRHRIVLLNVGPMFEIPAELCHSQDDQTLARARARFQITASSLKDLIARHNVRYINASFGETTDILRAKWGERCDTALPSTDKLREILALYEPIYGVLFNSEGVIAAHAAAVRGDLSSSPADFPFDQVNDEYPNQVRVGFFSSRTGVDAQGASDAPGRRGPADTRNADVFLNWGCERADTYVCADPHYELVAEFGLESATNTLMSTSFITPLGLARLVNLREEEHAGEAMSNTLVSHLKSEIAPSQCGGAKCIFQDPIKHRKLEIYRLGYR